MKNKPKLYSSLFIIISSLMILLGACSGEINHEKEAYNALITYLEDTYPESNNILEIEYLDYDDLSSNTFVTGTSSRGNDTWDIDSSYTYNSDKTFHETSGTNIFSAIVELVDDGDYYITSYLERENVRAGIDENSSQ